jgi:hypothetical protein
VPLDKGYGAPRRISFLPEAFFVLCTGMGDWAECGRESLRVGTQVLECSVEIFVLQVQDVRTPQECHEHEGYADGIHDAGDGVIV